MRRLAWLACVVAARAAPADLRLSVVTWNLAAKTPNARDCAWLSEVQQSDVVVVGAQEVEELGAALINDCGDGARRQRWRKRLRKSFSAKDYVLLPPHASGALDVCIFVKKNNFRSVVRCDFQDVACGMGNVLKNKGGIGAFLELDIGDKTASGKRRPLKLLVVVAHLAAHAPKVADRNSDYWRIVTELDDQKPDGWESSAKLSRSSARAPILDAADLVIFSGDLNYRLEVSREEAELVIAGHEPGQLFEALEFSDQLTRERAARRAFCGFAEGRVAFAPTFKYDKQAGTYDSSKKRRVPSWTDRIVYTPRPSSRRAAADAAGPALVLETYSAAQSAKCSDHRPVYATFRLRPPRQN
ncbi:Endonuclease/exonuclease/phosphatase [Pelagophyceae sp. CCMP2097]|nr:Endonuclease/exonuclease/phosphatase [Pelagophyceae sp. CCMP2097]